MSSEFWAVIVGAIIGGGISYIGIRYQAQKMIDLEIQKIKWNRYADKLLEIGELVTKSSVLIKTNIDRSADNYTDGYINYNTSIWGSSIRMTHFRKLSELLEDYEEYSVDAVLIGDQLNEERREEILSRTPTLANQIQKEIDKILELE